MQSKHSARRLALALLVAALAGCDPGTSTDDMFDPNADLAGQPSGDLAGQGPAATTAVRIIVEPSDNGSALLSAIQAAKTSIHMTMYQLTNSSVITALTTAAKAGKEVKVVLNASFPQGGNANQTTYTQLQSGGVQVHWAPSTFTYTHEKTVILDGTTAWIMTMNLTASSASSNREFLAVDTDPADIAEAEAIFQADFAAKAITPQGKLVVSPDNSRPMLVNLINGATTTVDVEDETLSDYMIVDALTAKARAGLPVRVLLSDGATSTDQSVQLLKQNGVQVRILSTPYIHAKAIVIDGKLAYVGSENLTANSLTNNRELGVIIAKDVNVVQSTITADFNAGTAL